MTPLPALLSELPAIEARATSLSHDQIPPWHRAAYKDRDTLLAIVRGLKELLSEHNCGSRDNCPGCIGDASKCPPSCLASRTEAALKERA